MDIEDALLQVSFTLVRFAGFGANAVLFGLVPILLIVVRPALKRLDATIYAPGRAELARRLEGLVQAGLVASAIAALLAILLQAVVISTLENGDVSGSSIASVFDTSFGRWYLLRLPLLGALGVLLVGRVRATSLSGYAENEAPPSTTWLQMWAVLALGLLATSTFSGHAAVSQPRGLALFNDVVHLAAGATWFAGVVVLAVALPDLWRGRSERERVAALAEMVDLFSNVAFVAIAIVLITGVLNSFFNLESFGDLAGSGYGRTLMLKLTLFVVIVVTGGVNHYALRRRLKREVASDTPAGSQYLFRRTIALELAIGLGLMATTGLLTGLARTRPASAAPAISSPAESF
ncbi:MAG: copper resistance D family protein, partial [Actinomycetota bacterium]